MNAKLRELEEGLKRMFKHDANSFIATVETQTDYLCDVKDLNGTLYPDVRKSATENKSGIIYTYSSNSFVLVSRLSGANQLYVSMFSDLEGIKMQVGTSTVEIKDGEIKFNGGQNGGILIHSSVSAEIAKLNAAILTLVTATAAGLATIPTVGGASSSAFTSACAAIQQANLTNAANTKIKH